MKKSKFAVAALTAAVLGTSALGLAACGKDGSPSNNNTNNNNTTTDVVRTITFKADEGAYKTGVDEVVATVTNGVANITELPGADKFDAPTDHSDWTFKGWALTTDNDGDPLTLAQIVAAITTSDINVYAIWSPAPAVQKVTVTFTVGTDGTLKVATESSRQVDKDAAIGTLPEVTPNTGKKFEGWYTAATGGSKVTADTTVSATTELFAQYSDDNGQETPPTPQKVTITFDAGDGTLTTAADASRQINKGAAVGTLPTVTAPTGREFTGWYTDATEGSQVTATTTFNENKTLYARYEDAFEYTATKLTVGGTDVTITRLGINSTEQGYGKNANYGTEAITLAVGDVVKIYNGSTVLNFNVDSNDNTALALFGNTTEAVSEKATIAAGKYKLYVAHYNTDTAWSLSAEEIDDGEPDPPSPPTPNEATEITLQVNPTNSAEAYFSKVLLTANQKIKLKYNGSILESPALQAASTGCNQNITFEGDVGTVSTTGYYTLYVNNTDGSNGWLTYDGEYEAPAEDKGGIYNGATPVTGGAFSYNSAGINEVMAQGVTITAGQTLTLKYGGSAVTGATLSSRYLMKSHLAADGTLTDLPAGTYDFYYDFHSKMLYVDIAGYTDTAIHMAGKIDGAENWNSNLGAFVTDGTETFIIVNITSSIEFGYDVWGTGGGWRDGSNMDTLSVTGFTVGTNGNNCKITGSGQFKIVITIEANNTPKITNIIRVA